MKKWFVFLILIFGFGLFASQKLDINEEKEKINRYIDEIEKDKNVMKTTFKKNEDGKETEFEYWEKGNELVKISRKWNILNGEYIDTTEQIFYLKNDERIYASESIMYKGKMDPEDLGGWKVDFWIKNNVVFDQISLGHGKTELDDWDYEKEIRENFKSIKKVVQYYRTKNKNTTR